MKYTMVLIAVYDIIYQRAQLNFLYELLFI